MNIAKTVIAIFSLLHLSDVMANSCAVPLKLSSSDFAPLVYQTPTGVQGTAYQEVSSLLARHSLSAEIDMVLWPRALKQAQEGEVEGIFPALKSSRRQQFLHYIDHPIGEVSIALYSSSNSPYAKGEKLQVTSQNTIGTLRELEYQNMDLHGAKVFEVNGFTQALEMLRLGRLDFVIAVKEIANRYIEENNITDLAELKTIERRHVYLALARNHPRFNDNLTCF